MKVVTYAVGKPPSFVLGYPFELSLLQLCHLKKNVFFFPLKLQVKHIHTHTFLSEARSRPHRSFVSYRNVYSFFAFPLFMASQCTPNAIHITNDAPSSGSLSVLFFLLVFYTTFIYYPLVSSFFSLLSISLSQIIYNCNVYD